MARVFITGSSSGLGLMTAEFLIRDGHQVVLHARDQLRADAAMASAVGAESIVVGDVSKIAEMKFVTEQVNRLGHFDTVIHNVGIGYRESRRIETEDFLPHVFAVNVVAPYVLTALIEPPDRLIYLGSGINRRMNADLDDLLWTKRSWDGLQAYGESKLYDVLLAFAIARLWPIVKSNAVEPGWVATRMGGPDAPDDINQAHLTQAWLAVSEDALALSTGKYFYHQAVHDVNPIAHDEHIQNELLEACARLTNIELPLH